MYRQCSRLKFTRIWDRPIAIAGLEKQLIHALKTRSGCDVLDDDGRGLLRRILSWHRGSDENTLEPLGFPGGGRQVVAILTWSWMTYKGGIDYLELPFDRLDWEDQEVQSPWKSGSSEFWHIGDRAGIAELSGIARGFDFGHCPNRKRRSYMTFR